MADQAIPTANGTAQAWSRRLTSLATLPPTGGVLVYSDAATAGLSDPLTQMHDHWTAGSNGEVQHYLIVDATGADVTLGAFADAHLQVYGSSNTDAERAAISLHVSSPFPDLYLCANTDTVQDLAFGAYRDRTAGTWKAGSTEAFLIQRSGDRLALYFDDSLTAGSTEPGWNTAWYYDIGDAQQYFARAIKSVSADTTQNPVYVDRSTVSAAGTGSADPGIWVEQGTGSSGGRGVTVQFDIASPTTSEWYFVCRDSGGTVEGRIQGDGAGGTTFQGTSDARVKRNIRDAEAVQDARATVRAMRLREWQHIHNPAPDAPRGLGWVAQELAEVFPEAVTPPHPDLPEGHPDDVWGIDFFALLPLAFAALKEQDAEIEDLRARLAALEAR